MVIITWKEDPLLKDKDIEYVTETKYQNTKFINLYKALVKTKDFVSIETLLNKTPYLNGKELIEYVSALLKDKYGDFDKGLMEATKALEKYIQINYYLAYRAKYRYKQSLKRNLINIVFARVISLLVSDNLEESITKFNRFLDKAEYFSDGSNSKVKLPITLEYLLNDKIVYLAGIIAGDGHLDEHRSMIKIVDGHKDVQFARMSKKQIENIFLLFEHFFGVKNKVIEDHKTWFLLSINNKWICRFFNYFFELPFGLKFDKIKMPSVLNFCPEKEGVYWRGLLDSDGSIRPKLKAIKFSTASKHLKEDLDRFFEKNKINPINSIMKNGNFVSYITSLDYPKFAQLVGSSHPRKSQNLIDHLIEGPKYRVFSGVDKKKLTVDGLYDFLQNNTICVDGFENIISEIRLKSNLTLKEFGNRIGLSPKEVWRLENKEKPITFSILKKILESFRLPKNWIFDILSKKNIRFYTSQSPVRVKLPLKPTENLIEIINCLRVCGNSVYIRLSENLGNANEEDISKKLEEVEKVFGIKPTRVIKENRKHNQYYLCSKAVAVFLKEFHKYELPWKPFSDKEIKELENKWSLC